MKKIISKIIVSTMLLIILSGTIFMNTSNAGFNMTHAHLQSRGRFINLIRRGDIGLINTVVVHEINGVEFPAYCIQRELPRS